MNKASSATGWVRNPVMKSPELDPTQASSYEMGWTLNPITGCLYGCEYCYARRLANGRLKQMYLRNPNVAPIQTDGPGYQTSKILDGIDPFYPRLWEERLRELDYTWKGKHFTVGGASKVQPKGIFVCDMSDLFGIGIPEEWTRKVLSVIRQNPHHRFYLLTKQPQNLAKFSPFPDNCWVGVTVTNEDMLFDAADALESIEASVKYLSIEPLLHWRDAAQGFSFGLSFTDWIIIGGQSGRDKFYPPESWIKEIENVADKAGIPVFEKDNLREIWDKPPRQEVPK